MSTISRKIFILRLSLFALVLTLSIPLALTHLLTRDLHSAVYLPSGISSESVEDVAFESEDGVALSGWYHKGQPRKTAVVLCHGVGANRAQMLQQAVFLAGLGHSVLAFDFRNHGLSGGSRTTYGHFEKLDVMAAARWLSSRHEDAPLALWGLSMGAASALLAAPDCPVVDGVIAESPFDSLKDTFYHHSKLYFGIPGFPLVDLTLLSMSFFLGFDSDEVSPIASVRRSEKIPILFIAGRQDRRMTPKLVAEIADAHPGYHEMRVFEGSHAFIFSDRATGYKEALADFLSKLEK